MQADIYNDIILQELENEMGRYINPANESKEEFLAREGVEIPRTDAKLENVPEDSVLVALVDNGAFTAAALIETERDLRDIRSPEETRPVRFFIVKRDALKDNAPDNKEAFQRMVKKGELVEPHLIITRE